MSLREQFPSDLVTVFHNTDEFATTREFRVANATGGFTIFNADVVWDEESAKKLTAVTVNGVYNGQVVCFIQHKDLTRPPVAGELIYSPANQPWEIIDVTDEESEWKLMLGMYRSQPGRYQQSA